VNAPLNALTELRARLEAGDAPADILAPTSPTRIALEAATDHLVEFEARRDALMRHCGEASAPTDDYHGSDSHA